MTKVEILPESKLTADTSETVEKLIEVMGVNVLNSAELKAKAEIISKYVRKTEVACKKARIKNNSTREALGRVFGIPGILLFLVGAIWSIVNLGVTLFGMEVTASWICGTSLLIGGFVLAVVGIKIGIFPTCVCCGKRKAILWMNTCNLCLQNDILALTGGRKAPGYAVNAAKARLENFISERMRKVFLNEVHELSSGMLLPAAWNTKDHQVFKLHDPQVIMPPEVEEKIERLKTTRVAPYITEIKAFLKPYQDPIAVQVSLLGFIEWFKLAEWPK